MTDPFSAKFRPLGGGIGNNLFEVVGLEGPSDSDLGRFELWEISPLDEPVFDHCDAPSGGAFG